MGAGRLAGRGAPRFPPSPRLLKLLNPTRLFSFPGIAAAPILPFSLSVLAFSSSAFAPAPASGTPNGGGLAPASPAALPPGRGAAGAYPGTKLGSRRATTAPLPEMSGNLMRDGAAACFTLEVHGATVRAACWDGRGAKPLPFDAQKTGACPATLKIDDASQFIKWTRKKPSQRAAEPHLAGAKVGGGKRRRWWRLLLLLRQRRRCCCDGHCGPNYGVYGLPASGRRPPPSIAEMERTSI